MITLNDYLYSGDTILRILHWNPVQRFNMKSMQKRLISKRRL